MHIDRVIYKFCIFINLLLIHFLCELMYMYSKNVSLLPYEVIHNISAFHPQVWEGKGVVKTGRVLLGATNPADSLPGTIRGDYCIDVGRNICHGSDAIESAQKEIDLWFKPDELVEWDPAQKTWVYE